MFASQNQQLPEFSKKSGMQTRAKVLKHMISLCNDLIVVEVIYSCYMSKTVHPKLTITYTVNVASLTRSCLHGLVNGHLRCNQKIRSWLWLNEVLK